MYKNVTEFRRIKIRIENNILNDFEKYLEYASELQGERVSASDVLARHFCDIDGRLKFNRGKEPHTTITVRLPKYAITNINNISEEYNIDRNCIVEKIIRNLLKNKKYVKWSSKNNCSLIYDNSTINTNMTNQTRA